MLSRRLSLAQGCKLLTVPFTAEEIKLATFLPHHSAHMKCKSTHIGVISGVLSTELCTDGRLPHMRPKLIQHSLPIDRQRSLLTHQAVKAAQSHIYPM
jgi:hypothetical protein